MRLRQPAHVRVFFILLSPDQTRIKGREGQGFYLVPDEAVEVKLCLDGISGLVW